ncbi:hypothetical protein, partial [Escherichia coli]|uniref:hypothetical protein n=1 Tax=Escherichia coli TaxID=562 RepID=UPI001436BB06
AEEHGVGLVTGGRNQAPLLLDRDAITPAVDLVRTPSGLSLRPLLVRGEAATVETIPAPFSLIGDPGIGIATWTPG